MNLSAAQIRYLLVIYGLSQEGRIRSNEIAEQIKVSRPSVHRMLGQLEKMELITKERYSAVTLTPSGLETAEKYYEKFGRISSYFMDNMRVSEDTAKESAIVLLGELDEQQSLEINNRIARLSVKS